MAAQAVGPDGATGALGASGIVRNYISAWEAVADDQNRREACRAAPPLRRHRRSCGSPSQDGRSGHDPLGRQVGDLPLLRLSAEAGPLQPLVVEVVSPARLLERVEDFLP